MPKLKTHKGAQKRFRFTGSGKIKRDHAFASHIMTKKSSKRKRHLRMQAIVVPEEFKKIKELLPYG
jgi:large subunit ribosomal protein L35